MDNVINYKSSLAYISVSKKKLYGPQGDLVWEDQLVLSTQPFCGPTETVSVSLTRTVNIHNFESVQIFVSRSIPVVPGEQNANSAYQECLSWVGNKINEQIRKVVDFRDKRGNGNQEQQQQQKKFAKSISY